MDPVSIEIPGWSDAGLRSVGVERCGTLTRAEFVERFARPNRPVLLTEATAGWPALERWTLSFFRERHGAMEVELYAWDDEKRRRTVRLGEYLEQLEQGVAADGWYLGSWPFARQCPELLEDYRVPEAFAEDWVQRLEPAQRPELRWLFIGPAGTGSPMHLDVAYSAAWNAVVSGRKLFVLFPPAQTERIVESLSDLETDFDVFAPDRAAFPDLDQAVPLACEVGPGELIFTPSSWFHQVLNLETSVAITQNFVDETNYRTVRRALRRNCEPWLEGLLRMLESV